VYQFGAYDGHLAPIQGSKLSECQRKMMHCINSDDFPSCAGTAAPDPDTQGVAQYIVFSATSYFTRRGISGTEMVRTAPVRGSGASRAGRDYG
jgi:hypothetical protein